jgi:Pyruvate/2-oxoacid:ferredoxin oxidoreductase delta subunit
MTSRAALTIDGRCTACGACLITCPEDALLPAPKRPALLSHRCTGCLACIEVCPAGAISEASA